MQVTIYINGKETEITLTESQVKDLTKKITGNIIKMLNTHSEAFSRNLKVLIESLNKN